MTQTPQDPAQWEAMRDVLSRVAVGPQGSKSLSRSEAAEALGWVLSGDVSPIQAGIFLVALRLKRETDEENLGFLDALLAASTVEQAEVADVVSFADPYDGFIRTPHYAPVAAAIVSTAGLPAYIHGSATLAPKFGVTHRQVFAAAGIQVPVGGGASATREACARLASEGVAYLGVEDFCPGLSALDDLRREIAKRPFLATLEKLITPLRGKERTHVVSSWVHRGYEDLLVLLLRDLGIDSVLLVRGREGHVDPHVHRDTDTLGYGLDGAANDEVVQPKCYGTLLPKGPGDVDITPESLAALWDEALHPKLRTHPGQTVRLLAGLTLCRAGVASTTMRGVGLAHKAIVSGEARRALERFAG